MGLIINGIILAIALIWLIIEPKFDSLIAVFTALASLSLASQVVYKYKVKKNIKNHITAENVINNAQAGRDIIITSKKK